MCLKEIIEWITDGTITLFKLVEELQHNCSKEQRSRKHMWSGEAINTTPIVIENGCH